MTPKGLDARRTSPTPVVGGKCVLTSRFIDLVDGGLIDSSLTMHRPPNIQTERLLLAVLLPEEIEGLLAGAVGRVALFPMRQLVNKYERVAVRKSLVLCLTGS